MTPHNSAKKGDIANTVIMPGDPLRAKWIAEKYLANSKLVSEVRGIPAYTGSYKGRTISIMAHGMGIPSIGIYTYELYHFYDVENIIRIGSAGSYTKDINPGDVIIAKEVISYSKYAEDIGVPIKDKKLFASQKLFDFAESAAQDLKIKAKSCRSFCSDTFYNKYTLEENIRRSDNCEVVEMEGFALYANAAHFNKNALMLLTCSDSLVTDEAMNAEERQNSFSDMVEIAFNIANRI